MRAARGYAAHFATYFDKRLALQRLVVACNGDGGPKGALIAAFTAMRAEQNAAHHYAQHSGQAAGPSGGDPESKPVSEGDGPSDSCTPPEAGMLAPPAGKPCLWPPLEESLTVDFFFYDDEDYDFLAFNAVRFFWWLGMVRANHVAEASRDAWASYDSAQVANTTAGGRSDS